MFDAAEPDNPLCASPFQFSFDKHFRAHANAQRQILIEARHRTPATRTKDRVSDGEVFIVHGHGEAHLHSLARLVKTLTGRDPVILREQPNQGRTIVEKFETHAARCSFALVLLTADDIGRAVDDSKEQARARQNVVFEAGYFVGLLGRANVVLLYEEGVELPSDLSGVLYVELTSGWQTEVGKEMRAAGTEVDLNRL